MIKTLAEVEKETIIEALKVCKGNRREAARHLGISTATIYRKVDQYGLTRELIERVTDSQIGA